MTKRGLPPDLGTIAREAKEVVSPESSIVALELAVDAAGADMYEEGCACVPRGDVRGVCGRRNIIASGELGAELGVSGRLGIKRAE